MSSSSSSSPSAAVAISFEGFMKLLSALDQNAQSKEDELNTLIMSYRTRVQADTDKIAGFVEEVKDMGFYDDNSYNPYAGKSIAAIMEGVPEVFTDPDGDSEEERRMRKEEKERRRAEEKKKRELLRLEKERRRREREEEEEEEERKRLEMEEEEEERKRREEEERKKREEEEERARLIAEQQQHHHQHQIAVAEEDERKKKRTSSEVEAKYSESDSSSSSEEDDDDDDDDEKHENICFICKKPVSDDELHVMGKCCHKQCFRCSKCMKQLAKYHMGPSCKPICPECYAADSANRCQVCGQLIGTAGHVEVGSKKYHTACFCCANCGRKLTQRHFPADGKIYCSPECVNMATGQMCHRCGLALSGRVITVLGKKFHSECFACTSCGTPFPALKFFPVDNEPYCESCAQRLLSEKE